jgi:uncharacterized protein involved in cysteine biosynthesis
MQADLLSGAGTNRAGGRAARGGLAGFEEGLRLLLEGAGFLRREPSLWPLAIVPVFLSLFFVAIAGSLFLANLGAITAWCSSLLPVVQATQGWHWIWVGPATLLVWIAGGLAVVVAFGVAIVAALLAANLASAPFLERLSFRVEAIVQAGDPIDAGTALGGVLVAFRSLAAELARLGLLAVLWIGLALVGLVVPGALFLTAPALVFVTIFFLPLEYAGHAFDRRGVSFVDRLRFVAAHRATMAGFGSVAFVACFVPGLNLVMMPALVTAGTLFVERHDPVTEGESVADLTSFSETET